MAVKNTAELRTLLLDTIEDVREGTIDPKKGMTIGALAGKVLQAARLDLEVIRLHRLNGKLGTSFQPTQLIGGGATLTKLRK